MRRSVRVSGLLLTVCSMLCFILLGPPRGIAAASSLQPSYPGHTEVTGPLHLSVNLTPTVAAPRDLLTLELILTNQQTAAATPEVIVNLPGNLAYTEQRIPTGMTYNYQRNSFTWLPVVAADGGQQRLTLPLRAAVADVSQPEQTITVIMRAASTERTASLTYWVGLPPTASINLNPPMVAVGQPVELQVNEGGPGPFVQSWNLGDGRIITARNPIVVYPAPGTYEITTQVANPLTYTQARAIVTVVPQPTAAFSLNDSAPVIQQPIQFINGSGGQPPLSYHWDFGDGTSSQDANPTHQYSEAGEYLVHLTVESEFGTAETSLPLTVGWAPVADFTITDNAATGVPISAQAFHDDNVTHVNWDMGDGSHYEGDTINHVYRQVGDFVVTMTASNQFGDTRVAHWVHVSPGLFAILLPSISNGADPGMADLVTVQTPPPAPVEVTAVEAVAAPPAPETVVTAPTPPAIEGAVVEDAGIVEEQVTPGGAPAAPQTASPATEAPATFIPVELPPQTPLPAEATPAESLLWYINEARRIHGLPPLAYNYELSIAAQLHTGDMAGNADIMHDGSDDSTPAERQQRYGYNGIYGGEAVAWGWESPVPVVEFWVNSPPHRALILNPNAKEVGVGFTADGTAPNLWYWAAEFGIRLEDGPEIQP